ncbi:MAG: hypothetical protein E1N59_268 [Puniceicoccaceae bacterium 5H]|nr:MAG: hypothetical protein E1N59_268 [Puniceicoccaceae bacterium 5H]
MAEGLSISPHTAGGLPRTGSRTAAGWLASPVAWGVAFGLAAIVFLAYGLARPYMLDDSVFLIFSEDWARGLNPYVIHDNKLPSTFLVFGSAMKLLGHHWWTGRLVSWIIMLATAAICIQPLKGKLRAHELRWLMVVSLLALWFAEGSLVMTEAGLGFCSGLGLWMLRDRPLGAKAACLAGLVFAAAATFKQVGYGLPIAYTAMAFMQCLGRRTTIKEAFVGTAWHWLGFIAFTAAYWSLAYWQGIAELLWQRAFLDMMGYERRYSLSGFLLVALRLGWFVVPALAVAAVRFFQGKIWKDDAIFHLALFVALGFLLPLQKRPYAHYALAAVPALMVLLGYGWQFYGRKWSERLLRPQWITLGAIGACVIVAGGVALKHESLARIFGFSDRPEIREHAHELGAYFSQPGQHALFLDRGPDDLKPAALYYYTGARPNFPFLFFHNMPAYALDPWIAQLPELAKDPDLQLVIFNPEHSYHPYWSPIPDDVRAELHAVLLENYERRPSLGNEWIWVRRGAEPDTTANLARGPYASL